MVVWLFGFLVVGLFGCLVVWSFACSTVGLRGCLVDLSFGCLVAWVVDDLVVGLLGVFWLFFSMPGVLNRLRSVFNSCLVFSEGVAGFLRSHARRQRAPRGVRGAAGAAGARKFEAGNAFLVILRLGVSFCKSGGNT